MISSDTPVDKLSEDWGLRRPRFQLSCGARQLMVESGGFCDFIEHPRNGRHSHPHFELCFVLEGEGYFRFQHAASLVRKGDVFLADPKRIHEIDAEHSRNLRLFFFGFAVASAQESFETQVADSLGVSPETAEHIDLGGAYAKPFTATLERFAVQHLLIRRNQRALLSLLSAACSTRSSLWKPAFIQFCFAAIESLCRPSSSEVFSFSESNRPVRRAIDVIEQELATINANRLAEAVNSSPRHLYRLFQRSLGRSPKEEILRRRMQRAEDLLKMNFPVKEVAFRLGGDDPANFSRVFKQFSGVTPAQYRKRYTQN